MKVSSARKTRDIKGEHFHIQQILAPAYACGKQQNQKLKNCNNYNPLSNRD